MHKYVHTYVCHYVININFFFCTIEKKRLTLLYAVKKNTIRHIIFEIVYNISFHSLALIEFGYNIHNNQSIRGLTVSRLSNRFIVSQLFHLNYEF